MSDDGNESSPSSHEEDASQSSRHSSNLEDGEIILSKTKKKNKKNKNQRVINNSKKEFYLRAKEDFEEISCQLPHQFGNILVLSFGEIKSSQNFYTKDKIYPVGYKCEVTIKNSNSNNILLVEVVEMDNQLEFMVTLSSNRVLVVSSEAEIFEKVSVFSLSSFIFYGLILIDFLPVVICL
jgi:hypothetical protein